MRVEIMSSEVYVHRKSKLIEAFQIWESTFSEYEKKYGIRNKTLHYAWKKTFTEVYEHLKSDLKAADCFLAYNNKNVLQGIAFGAKLPYGNLSDWLQVKKCPSYHIFSIITAPWNIIDRCFTSNVKDSYAGIGAHLMQAIMAYVKPLDVSQIVVEPDHHFNVGNFFRKFLFTQVSDVKIGYAFELEKSMFNQLKIADVFNKKNNVTLFKDQLNIVYDYCIENNSQIKKLL